MRKITVSFLLVLLGVLPVQGAMAVVDDGGTQAIPPPEVLLGQGPDGDVTPTAHPPRSMRNLVLHAGHREVRSLHLADTEFRYIAPFSELPFLLWPADGGMAVSFAHDGTSRT